MRVFALALAFFFAGLLPAADLIQSPAAVVRAPSVGTWTVIDSGLAIVATTPMDGGRSILLAQPGRYRVLWAANGQTATTLVDVGGATPGPSPKPVDPPAPPPQPIPAPDVVPAAEIWVTVLREEQDTTVPQQRIIEAGIAWTKSHKHHFRTLDDDVTDVDGKPSPEVEALRRYLGDTPLPAIVICNRDGTHLGHFALPDTAEKLTAELEKYGK